ncbi:MAG TPA: tetrahydromethanopterin S-methyltransferase subunit A [Methanoculleus sp.]|jgi:tetrahydromethanopterin S-methyltransferase subunit A|uniref:tetrahydromethanopterin S-methyltransferase subunit A n=1 Tax=Methanoculleus sp. TaxID=90427 RepID=UPI002BE88449|nr:tetrahydromethanopterin S-methyltransferase subunit A [Methanoculleus sp.]HNQ32327.1 tetrahydromethanopterin S-methyltransferase subunit A [Methanoculleus sp.]HNT07782.1 tetrahydromethanopterin S-methyltransferase subunit A [Methanoculleus sp.]HOF95528.1 tetrahydromethanopterin S-methyltransferase subunit A [Methanoculleus sp.]HOZ41961.1 tetrahydromethanopterin S-methyltransferase subunit A [Methanoculleus sp.]HQL58761.1 tetrahydromethanopterin S-methyltransferase subunit A [Methanoculleus 
MAEKKSPASGWPIVQGDFHTGDAQSCVGVVTMGSHLDEQGICDAGAAIAGSCKTENLGLEKVIANVISNPNIRFILCCGTEVKGHLSGQSFIALHAGGVSGGKIVGAEGAIPFIENLSDEAIKRFQEQTEIVNIMESEDMGTIKAKINELKARDPGAFPAEPMVVEVKEAAGAAEVAVAGANPQFLEIEERLNAIEERIEFVDAEIAQRVGRKIGRDIGILYGLVAGLIVFMMLLVLLPKLVGYL